MLGLEITGIGKCVGGGLMWHCWQDINRQSIELTWPVLYVTQPCFRHPTLVKIHCFCLSVANPDRGGWVAAEKPFPLSEKD